jgi:hypothetical protein
MKKPTFTVRHLVAAVVATGLTGCASQVVTEQKRSSTDLDAARTTMETPSPVVHRDRVKVTSRSVIPVVPATDTSKHPQLAWLQKVRVQLKLDQPVPLTQVVKIFSAHGVNITSALPLEAYTYSGYGINNTDAETALKMILGGLGLDYEVDNVRQMVHIKPMSSKTWYLNIGNRRTNFSSSSSAGNGLGSNSMAGGSTGGAGSASNGGSSSVSSIDDFWGSLRAELQKRLSIMVPVPPPKPNQNPPQPQFAQILAAPMLAQPLVMGNGTAPGAMAPGMLQAPGQTAQAAQQFIIAQQQPNPGGGPLFSSKQIGDASVNPETGAVMVQAPHWILAEIDPYMKRVQEMYNTELSFSGYLLMVSTDNRKSEGFDVAAFNTFARNRYGAAFFNNSMGDVTVLRPVPGNDIPARISAGKDLVSNTILGLTDAVTGIQIFNNYLESLGTVKVAAKPRLATASGVPTEFSKMVTEYINSVNQTAAAGAVGGSAVGTQNQMIPFDFGTELKINPRFDVSTGLVRAQITMMQVIKSGNQIVNQQLNGAGGAIVTVAQEVPRIMRLRYTGEALVADGDTIIVGGQSDDDTDASDNGVTKLKDAPGVIGGLFGQKAINARQSTYYIALKVSVTKRDTNPRQNMN